MKIADLQLQIDVPSEALLSAGVGASCAIDSFRAALARMSLGVMSTAALGMLPAV